MPRITFALVAVYFTVLACSSKNRENPESALPSKPVQEINEYPEIGLRFDDGREVSARTLKGNNIFVFFQPDCDHCQEEAIFIEQRLEDFKDYTLYFISSAPMADISGFAGNFGLNEHENVKFAWSSTEGVLNHYGAIQTPSVYIYSDGRLKQSFNGQTDVENILNAL